MNAHLNCRFAEFLFAVYHPSAVREINPFRFSREFEAKATSGSAATLNPSQTVVIELEYVVNLILNFLSREKNVTTVFLLLQLPKYALRQ